MDVGMNMGMDVDVDMGMNMDADMGMNTGTDMDVDFLSDSSRKRRISHALCTPPSGGLSREQHLIRSPNRT